MSLDQVLRGLKNVCSMFLNVAQRQFTTDTNRVFSSRIAIIGLVGN